jgi:hypothetical protein
MNKMLTDSVADLSDFPDDYANTIVNFLAAKYPQANSRQLEYLIGGYMWGARGMIRWLHPGLKKDECPDVDQALMKVFDAANTILANISASRLKRARRNRLKQAVKDKKRRNPESRRKD